MPCREFFWCHIRDDVLVSRSLFLFSAVCTRTIDRLVLRISLRVWPAYLFLIELVFHSDTAVCRCVYFSAIVQRILRFVFAPVQVFHRFDSFESQQLPAQFNNHHLILALLIVTFSRSFLCDMKLYVDCACVDRGGGSSHVFCL